MTDLESNTLVPEEELRAALTEIEKLSGEEAAAIPSLDDGHEGAREAAAGPPAPEIAEASISKAADAPAPEIAEAPFSEAEVDTTLEELRAVAADIDESFAESDTSEPTCASEGEAAAAVESDEGEPSKPLVGEPSGRGRPGEQALTSGARSAQKGLRFKIGKKSSDEDVAAYRPPDERGKAVVIRGVARPATPLAKRVYRAVDRALDAVNRPFAWLGDTGRALVGWVALATLIVSILAMVLIPMILPHRDAITFLQEKRAQLEALRPDASQPEAPRLDGSEPDPSHADASQADASQPNEAGDSSP